jgi:HD-GYP domain-containing protein (c-di-GMP phosphodiesterase class II)
MQSNAARLEAVAENQEYRLAEIVASLSYALDLTEGQPPGHTLRATAIGMRFAEELGLNHAERAALYYALLLKDAGCSSNASQVADRFGSDDGPVKRDLKTRNWSSTLQCASYAWDNAARGGSLIERFQHFTRIAAGGRGLARELVRVRCYRGAEIVTRLGFPVATVEAVRCLDEHWDGKGYPNGIAGDAIPLPARIASLAQTLEVFLTAEGSAAALALAQQRRGSWFDPALVDRCVAWRHDHAWWHDLLEEDLAVHVQALEPGEHALRLDDDGLDRVAEAFADIIDAKSPYTSAHSSNVARYGAGIAQSFGLSDTQMRSLYRAALLHDVGKLGISNRILDKAAPLSPEERDVIQQHPLFSWSILRRVGTFRDFAWTAALHHERLDGSGYPWRVHGDELGLEARILAVADVYEALTARRPYREGLPVEQALQILGKDTPFRYDSRVFTALEAFLGH